MLSATLDASCFINGASRISMYYIGQNKKKRNFYVILHATKQRWIHNSPAITRPTWEEVHLVEVLFPTITAMNFFPNT